MTARMARLRLSPVELERLGRAVEQMLAHFSHMREIDVEGLAPTTHALLRENRTREDVESPGLPPTRSSRTHPSARTASSSSRTYSEQRNAPTGRQSGNGLARHSD